MPRKTARPSHVHKREIHNLPQSVKQEATRPSKNKEQEKITLESKTKAITDSLSKNSVSSNTHDKNHVKPTNSSSDEQKRSTTLYGRIYNLSKRSRVYLVKNATLALPGIIVSIILMLLGIKETPKTVPLFIIVEQHPVGSPLIGSVLLLFGIVPLIISFLPEPNNNSRIPKHGLDWRSQRWIVATAASTISFFLSSTLLAVVLIRPVWCPTTLCAPPERIPIIHGFHDNNLEIYFTAFQGASYVIPGDPTQYSLANLPQSEKSQSIGAVLIGGKSVLPYRIVLGIHSIQQGSFGLIIKKVELVIGQVPLVPDPLKVANVGIQRTYQSNVYQVNYVRENSGLTLAATYLPNGYFQPGLYVQLLPGESDELDVQVNSKVSVDLKFRIQVTYRVFNETETHTLLLPNLFEAVFSRKSNWHPYKLQAGHLVASP